MRILTAITIGLALSCSIAVNDTTASTYANVEELLTTDLHYDTFSVGSNRLRRFELTTSQGTLTGAVAASGDKTILVLAGRDGSLTLTVVPSMEGDILNVRVEDSDAGVAVFEFSEAGRSVLQNDFDCLGFRSSAFYSQLLISSVEYASVLPLVGLDPTEAAPFVQVFDLAIGLPLRTPGYLGCAEAVEPQGGICVVHGTWQQCVQCCDTESNISSTIGTGIAVFAALTGSSAASAVSIPFGLPDDCIARICEGKSGDETPTFCAIDLDTPGYCATACPQHGGSPDHGCGASLLCCPAAGVYCPGPYPECDCDPLDPNDPDCG